MPVKVEFMAVAILRQLPEESLLYLSTTRSKLPNACESALPCLSQRSLAALKARSTSSLVAWLPLGGSPDACGAELSALNIAAARAASASAVRWCSGPAGACSCPGLSRAGAVGEGGAECTDKAPVIY